MKPAFYFSLRHGIAWVRSGERGPGWQLKMPWHRRVFSERSGVSVPAFSFLGFRVFRLPAQRASARRICSECGKPILRHHKFTFEASEVRHHVCSAPTFYSKEEAALHPTTLELLP